jgi:hypothetical protein
MYMILMLNSTQLDLDSGFAWEYVKINCFMKDICSEYICIKKKWSSTWWVPTHNLVIRNLCWCWVGLWQHLICKHHGTATDIPYVQSSPSISVWNINVYKEFKHQNPLAQYPVQRVVNCKGFSLGILSLNTQVTCTSYFKFRWTNFFNISLLQFLGSVLPPHLTPVSGVCLGSVLS